MWTAAILAGGQARRLGGRDKGALQVGDARIVERQLAILRGLTDHLLIVANDAARYQGFGVPLVADAIRGAGALGGIYTALTASPTEQTLIMACDLPFLAAPFLCHLIACGAGVDVAIPRTADGYQPLCASYSRRCAAPIRRRIEAGDLRVTGVLADVRVREIGPEEIAPYDPGGTLFFNVNTPDDYDRAVALEARPGAVRP